MFKLFYTKSGNVIIGNVEEDNPELLCNILQYIIFPAGINPDRSISFLTIPITLGGPINKELKSLLLEDLGILFEITECDKEKIEKEYISVIESIKCPNIKKPKSTIIH